MRILFNGDAPQVNTGFGVVAKNLLLRLHNMGYEVNALGINWFGDPYDTKKVPYKVWPVDKGSLDLVYGFQKFWWVEEQTKPDLIFYLNDPWVVQKYIKHRPAGYDRYVKQIIYYPTDAGPMQPEWVKMLGEFDAQILYSNFAERVLKEANDGKLPSNAYQVYHGVDTEVFHPVNQSIARLSLGLDPKDFIVGMVARNQPRKRFDILAKGFADFAQDKPEAKLYLHTALNDVGFDIKDMCRQLGIGNKLIVTGGLTPNMGLPDEGLNLVYNSFDVNALISLGDGFGLPVAESMATHCPQLVSDHSCLEELVSGHGGLTVKTAAWLMNPGGFNTWGGLSDPSDLTRKLNTLYTNKDLRMKLADEGYDFIRQEKFTWDFAAQEFDKIIRKVSHILPRKGADNGYTTDTTIINTSGPTDNVQQIPVPVEV